MDLTPDDVRDVLRVLDSSGLDELHLELTDLTLTVRRVGASGWALEQQVLRRPVVEGGTEANGVAEQQRPRAAVPEGLVAGHLLPGPETGRAALRRCRWPG
jgi:acetyl-CoA carboxylase biotin carboxyl carrier protein